MFVSFFFATVSSSREYMLMNQWDRLTNVKMNATHK